MTNDDMSDKIEYMGNCYPDRRGGEKTPQEGMVFNPDGISPSIVATSYKGTMPKIVTACAIRGRGESGSLEAVPEQGGDIANSITTSQKASMIMEIGNIYHGAGNPLGGRVYDEQGISPTLRTMATGGNLQPKILTPHRTEYGKAIRKEYESGEVQESRHNMTELTPREDGCSNTLTSAQKDNLLLENKPKYRIRRLTEREVLRLMDVEEKDIDTLMNCGLSSTRIYAAAGNSIVVACLYHLFRKLFTETGNEEQQLSIF